VSGEVLNSDWLAERALRSPGALALCEGDRRLGYADLDRRVSEVARALCAAGVKPGARVAVGFGGLDFAVVAHAARRCGALLLPLNTRLSEREIATQLDDAETEQVLRDPGQLAALPPSDAAPPAPPDAGEPSTLIYTSGTTGAPKGALLSPRGFFASALASALHLGALPSDRWLACLPLFHVGGLSILWRSVLSGSAVVVQERFDPEQVDAALDRDGITCLSLTANMLARLLDARRDAPAPPTLRLLLLGGGPCPAPLVARAEAAGFPVAPTYGLTEAHSQVATRPPGAPPEVGATPLPGTALRIEAGEIWVRGPTLMNGYWRRPEASAAALRGGWLHTGDLGRLDEEGRLIVLDRRSDLIVSGGENVYPAEVEAALLAHPDVAEAGVAGVDDMEWGARPAAWVVLQPGADPDTESLRSHCRERLAGYKVPVAFHRASALPRTAAGKLQRHRLGEPDPAQR